MHFLLSLLTAASALPLDGGFLRTDTNGQFVDSLGRVRIFHGSNRVKKSAPWYFVDQLTEVEFKLMEQLGFTVMRLGFMWSGYNPAPGVFNQTYIDVVKSVVANAAAHGIYTLLDVHQDGLSSKFCLYDGMPLWVVNKSSSKHAFPWPFHGNCSSRGWEMNVISEAAATAYQDFYDNKAGMLDDFKAFWSSAAREFKDVASVIGYEIMNEPFAGDLYADPLVLLPGVAGRRNLQRMYDSIAPGIRDHDERHIIFYEPVTWGMIFDGKSFIGSGFDHVPGGSAYANRSAFSFHYYCDSFVPSYGDKPILRKVVCDDTVAPLVFSAVARETARLGGAAMMTEGMACDYDSHSSADECQRVMADLDTHLLSWTDYGVSQGSLWQPTAKQQEGWARTYARATAGTPLSMAFDPATKVFDFCFLSDPLVSAPTEIFASLQFSYKCGRKVNVTTNLVAESAGDVVLLRPATAPGAAPPARAVTPGCVHISRAACSGIGI
jgi:endoglycosylceramidase